MPNRFSGSTYPLPIQTGIDMSDYKRMYPIGVSLPVQLQAKPQLNVEARLDTLNAKILELESLIASLNKRDIETQVMIEYLKDMLDNKDLE